MGIGKHSTPKGVEKSDSTNSGWEKYFQRKNDYEKITCDINAIDLLNKSWVRIPTLANTPFNWTHTFTNNLFSTQISPTQADFSTKVEGTFAELADSVKSTLVEHDIALDKSNGPIHDKTGIKKADTKDQDGIDEEINLEDKRINGLFQKNIYHQANLKDIFDPNLFTTGDDQSYQRFYDIIDHIDIDNAMQVHDVQKKHEKEKIIEKSEKKEGLVYDPVKRDGADQPAFEETESDEIWKPLNGNTKAKVKGEQDKKTNPLSVGGTSEPQKVSTKAVKPPKRDILKILEQAIGIFSDAPCSNKDQLACTIVRQEKPKEDPSESQVKPTIKEKKISSEDFVVVNQENPLDIPSVNHETFNIIQERPLEKPVVNEINPLDIINSNQEDRSQAPRDQSSNRIQGKVITEKPEKSTIKNKIKPIKVKIVDIQGLNRDKPIKVRVYDISKPNPSETNVNKVQSGTKKIPSRPSNESPALIINQKENLETLNQVNPTETVNDNQGVSSPVQSVPSESSKVDQTVIVNQKESLENLKKDIPSETINANEEKVVQSDSKQILWIPSNHGLPLIISQKENLEKDKPTEEPIIANKDVSLTVQKVNEVIPSESSNASQGSQKDRLENLHQDKPSETINANQEISIPVLSINKEIPLASSKVNQEEGVEKVSQTNLVNQEKSLETQSPGQALKDHFEAAASKVQVKLQGDNQVESLKATSMSQDLPTQEKSPQTLSNSEVKQTVVVIQENPLSSNQEKLSQTFANEQKALKISDAIEERSIETPKIKEDKPLHKEDTLFTSPKAHVDVRIVKNDATKKEAMPSKIKEEKSLPIETISISNLEKDSDMELSEMVTKALNPKENIMKIELPGSPSVSKDIRSLVIENKLPFKSGE